ncbi:MAG: hypothetical protein J6W04_00130 [Bacteroidales bacterium]|nr:hypothetical protein [Bacteroidales bacterium]
MEYYIVVEVQMTSGAPSVLTTTYTAENQAWNKYYSVLAYAAMSDVPYHGAYIIGGTETAEVFESKFFEH